MRAGEASDVVVCAAGGLPGELHKLWRPGSPLGYHVEYGYSCMGYEIAGGIGVKMALPEREVVVAVGDGSYLMMNSEIATSVMLGQKLIIVLNDNRGFGCINRLQQATGGAPFNNLLRDAWHETLPAVDFVAHARSLGAEAVKVKSIAELEAAFKPARAAKSIPAKSAAFSAATAPATPEFAIATAGFTPSRCFHAPLTDAPSPAISTSAAHNCSPKRSWINIRTASFAAQRPNSQS